MLHNLCKVMAFGYPLSYLFKTKKNLLSYYNLLNMVAVIALLTATIYSFLHWTRAVPPPLRTQLSFHN
jgi:ABC-type maltose transport system permease subunit